MWLNQLIYIYIISQSINQSIGRATTLFFLYLVIQFLQYISIPCPYLLLIKHFFLICIPIVHDMIVHVSIHVLLRDHLSAGHGDEIVILIFFGFIPSILITILILPIIGAILDILLAEP